MGVTGLLEQLRSKRRNVQLYELLRDKDVGIDALVWLHMYVSVQHEEVSKGNFTSIVQGFIGRLKKLKTWGARPIVVFDGVSNEMKASTNSARSNKRDKMVQGLMEDLQACLNAGEEPSTALMEKISKANAGVTRDLVYAVIRQLRVEGYPYVVAPYEADHTLVALLHEGFIQYIISVDSGMLVHHGGNVVVIPTGFWQDGLGILYDPAANAAPADESNAPCDRPRDLGLIIDRVVGQHACEPREAAAAVCLAYALLVDSDYHNLKGVGQETALFVMELLLHRGVTLESWKDPDQLADILCNNYAKQRRKEDVVSDMKRAKGGLLGGIALHLAKREINYLDEKVAIDTGCIERFGKTSFDREQVDLIALGLLCMRDGCGCQREKPKHHDVGRGYSVIQPQDTVHPVQLTEDLIIGAKMCEEHVDTASLAQLARWLRTRGQFASGKKKHKLRASVRAQMAAEAVAKKENRQLTNLRCPEGLSVLQLLRNCGRNADLPLIDNAEAKAALAAIPSDRWITYIGEMQERAPLVSEQLLQKHFKDVCTKKGVFRKGYKRICFRTHLRGFAAYFVPNGDKPAKECWFRLHCPRSMVNATYPVFVRCSIEWHEAMDGRPPYVTKVCDQMCACPAARVDQGCVHVCALLQAVQNLRRRDPRDNCPTSMRCEWNTARAKVEEDLVNNEISYLVFEKADPSQQEQRKKHNPVCMSNDLGRGAYDPCPPAVVNSVLRDLQMREKSTLIPKIFELIEVCAQGTEEGETGMSVMYTKEHAAKTRYDLWYNYATAELQRTGLDKISTELSEAWESELCADDAEADPYEDNDDSV